MNSIVIPERFRGPPNSGNGGYTAGAFAAPLHTTEPVEVTLRSPVPLDRPLQVRHDDPLTVHDGDTLVAESRSVALDLVVPAPPAWKDVEDAAPTSYSLQEIHPAGQPDHLTIRGTGFHPICFCCGADHDDGLRVFAAPVNNGEQVAAIWQTQTAWAGNDGLVPAEYIWAALDCPGQFAFMADGIRTGMLGRITAQLHAPVAAGRDYLVTAWRVGVEGKKHFAGSALIDRDGTVLARALATWIGRRN